MPAFISSTTSRPTRSASRALDGEGRTPPGSRWSSESPTRELTLEEAISFAILLQKNEQLAEAHELFRRVLEAAPDHPRALHYAGVLAHQQGRNDEALALIERSLALVPDRRRLAQQLRHRPAIGRQAGCRDRRLPAGDRPRSGPRQRPQQSRRAAAGDRPAGRRGSRLSHGHPARSRTHRRLDEPRHPARTG